jgi:hypothetical protein
MLDALSVAYFCTNGVVFNWCSYLLEELLAACEEAQEPSPMDICCYHSQFSSGIHLWEGLQHY